MSSAAKSLFAFGVYLAGLGLVLLFVPNLLLQLFGVPPTIEVWIRIVGMMMLCLSVYYVLAAKREVTDFIRWTVPARVGVLIFFTLFVLLDWAPKPLLLFGLIDFAAAIWTWFALRADKRV